MSDVRFPLERTISVGLVAGIGAVAAWFGNAVVNGDKEIIRLQERLTHLESDHRELKLRVDRIQEQRR